MPKVTNIRSEEELKALRNERLKNGFKVLAVVGIGAGIYGYRLGRKSGYQKGVKDGYISASQEIIMAWKEHTDEMLGIRGD